MSDGLPEFVRRLEIRDEPRLALFDADGTLWEGDIADDFTLWMIGGGRVSTGALWDEYRRLYALDPEAGCRFLLRFYRGMSAEALAGRVREYWDAVMRLKPIEESVAALRYLAGRGFKVWVVTGSPTDLLLPLRERLPVDRIVGMDFELDEKGAATGRHGGVSCAGPGKARKVRELWRGPIQFAAGNARIDEAMLRLARDLAWAVRPHPDLEAIARAEGWAISP